MVLEELGMTIPNEARKWDRQTKLALHKQASKEAILKWGKDRWTIPRGNSNINLYLDLLAPIDPSNIFGLDTIQMPHHLCIKIPILHLYG